jgi:hypothetical protein
VRDLYNENYKGLKKEIKEETRRWKETFHVHKLRKLILSLQKVICRFNAISIKIPMTIFVNPVSQGCELPGQALPLESCLQPKIPMAFFTGIEKPTLKFTWKYKRHQIAKVILRQNSNLEISQYLTSKSTTQPQ